MMNKIPSLYKYQANAIQDDFKKKGLFFGTGVGKTRLGLELAEGSTLVICLKQGRDDLTWERNAKEFDIVVNMKVISKEDMRRDWDLLPEFDTVIIDECHKVFGVTADTVQRNYIQIPKTSQIFQAVYSYLKKHPPKRLYLCSATPVSKPMNLWAIAQLFGVNWNFFDFRNKYYLKIKNFWIVKKDDKLKDDMARLVKHFGYVGSLNDFFDVPEQTHKTVEIELSEEQRVALKRLSTQEADPRVRSARMRTIENGLLYGKKVESKGKVDIMTNQTILYKSYKIDYILERALEFPKLLIFANYTAQINQIAKELREEGYTVSTLTGATKDRTFIKTVDVSDKPHIIIAQSCISAGYELPSFPCVIYASKSWQFVDYEQSLGRVLRSNHLKKNLYIHLVVKGMDLNCHKVVMSGADFQEMLQLDTGVDTGI